MANYPAMRFWPMSDDLLKDLIRKEESINLLHAQNVRRNAEHAIYAKHRIKDHFGSPSDFPGRGSNNNIRYDSLPSVNDLSLPPQPTNHSLPPPPPPPRGRRVQRENTNMQGLMTFRYASEGRRQRSDGWSLDQQMYNSSKEAFQSVERAKIQDRSANQSPNRASHHQFHSVGSQSESVNESSQPRSTEPFKLSRFKNIKSKVDTGRSPVRKTKKSTK